MRRKDAGQRNFRTVEDRRRTTRHAHGIANRPDAPTFGLSELKPCEEPRQRLIPPAWGRTVLESGSATQSEGTNGEICAPSAKYRSTFHSWASNPMRSSASRNASRSMSLSVAPRQGRRSHGSRAPLRTRRSLSKPLRASIVERPTRTKCFAPSLLRRKVCAAPVAGCKKTSIRRRCFRGKSAVSLHFSWRPSPSAQYLEVPQGTGTLPA